MNTTTQEMHEIQYSYLFSNFTQDGGDYPQVVLTPTGGDFRTIKTSTSGG